MRRRFRAATWHNNSCCDLQKNLNIDPLEIQHPKLENSTHGIIESVTGANMEGFAYFKTLAETPA